MNDIGVNVAQVLDDLQCSYMNNSEYVRMSRIEEYNNSPKQGKFDLTKVLKDQGSDSRGFDDMWGGGIVMNWTLVPVEQQKPHINWRQAIDDDGSGLGRLASWMDINAGMTAAIVNATNNEAKINVYLKNQKSMDENKNNEEYRQYVNEGREHTENTVDLARSDYENYSDKIKEAIGNSTDLDVLAVLAAAVAEQHTTDYKMIVDSYRQCAQTIGSNNPALIWTAVGTNTTIVKRYIDGTLDTYLNGTPSAGSTSDSTDTTSGSTPTTPNEPSTPETTNTSKETELWTDFVSKIKEGLEKEGKTSTAGLNLFPKVCYMYVKLMNDIKNSSFDGDDWGFPYTDDVIQQTPEKCVFLTGHCGETSGHAGKHEGIDIQPSGVQENRSYNVPFCAVKDGIAYTEGQWCNGIYIKHDDGTWARFLHCRSRSVSNGERVQRGQQIGITGGHDGSSDNAYDVHLHVEFGEQRGKAPYEKVYNDDCLINPEDCWRKPNGTDNISGKPMWTL